MATIQIFRLPTETTYSETYIKYLIIFTKKIGRTKIPCKFQIVINNIKTTLSNFYNVCLKDAKAVIILSLYHSFFTELQKKKIIQHFIGPSITNIQIKNMFTIVKNTF